MKLRMRPAGAFLLLAAMSACDIPSGIPRWETEWITPGETTTVSVAELLPSGIGMNDDSTAFVLAIAQVADSWSLSDFCESCPLVAVMAPKPAFSGSVSTTAPIPAAVQSAAGEGGELMVSLTNGFSFDPIRPGVDADSGTMTVVVRSGAVQVASLAVDGRTQSFAPGSALHLTLDFVPATITGDLELELTMVSPAGDVTTLDPDDAIAVAISSPGIEVSEAVVQMDSQPIEAGEAELDLEDVDVGDRLQDATIYLDIENPFGVTGELSITVAPAEGPAVVKGPLTLDGAATQTLAVDFTEQEMESIVGRNNDLVIAGVVNGGAVTVRPDMALGVEVRLRATIEVGGDTDEDGDDDE